MYGSTKELLELITKGQREPDFPRVEDEGHVDNYDPKILQLKLKRKYQLGLIKKMMEDAGYGDLAKMTTVSKHNYDIEE